MRTSSCHDSALIQVRLGVLNFSRKILFPKEVRPCVMKNQSICTTSLASLVKLIWLHRPGYGAFTHCSLALAESHKKVVSSTRFWTLCVFHPLYHDGGIRCLVRPRVQVKNCIPPSHFSYFCHLSDEGKVSKPKYTVQLNTVYLSDNWPPDKEIWDKNEWQRLVYGFHGEASNKYVAE